MEMDNSEARNVAETDEYYTHTCFSFLLFIFNWKQGVI